MNMCYSVIYNNIEFNLACYGNLLIFEETHNPFWLNDTP